MKTSTLTKSASPTILCHPNFNPAEPTPDKVKPPVPFWQLALIRTVFALGGRLLPRFMAKRARNLLVAPRFKVIRDWQSEVEKMATPFTFQSGDLQLQAYQWGDGEKTVLLLHGWESRGLTMRKFVLPLLEQGFKVVTFDAPAHGKSDGTEIDYSIYGKAATTLATQIGNVHSIIGHSMGGITLLFQLAKLIRLQGSFPPAFQQLQKLVIVSAPTQVKATLDNFAQLLWLPEVLQQHMRQLIQNRYGYKLEALDTAIWAKEIPIEQALIVHDRYDAVVPFEVSERLNKHWDKAELVMTEGYGHNLIIRDKQVVECIVSFISRDNS